MDGNAEANEAQASAQPDLSSVLGVVTAPLVLFALNIVDKDNVLFYSVYGSCFAFVV